MDMDGLLNTKIEENVHNYLQGKDLDYVTPKMVLKHVSEMVGIDVSQPPFKQFVKDLLTAFLNDISKHGEPNEKEEDSSSEEESKEIEGGTLIFELSNTTFVTFHEFMGQKYVSVREFYKKKGERFYKPKAKGISMNMKEWSILKKNIARIDKAVEDMKANRNK